MNTRPSEQLRAPRRLVRGSTDDRTGRTAPVAQESGRSRRRPDEPDRDTHEHRRPAHRLKSEYNLRRRPMARPARRMRHFSITRARAATRIVRSGRCAPVPRCHRRHCRSPAGSSGFPSDASIGTGFLTVRSRCTASDTIGTCVRRTGGTRRLTEVHAEPHATRPFTGGAAPELLADGHPDCNGDRDAFT